MAAKLVKDGEANVELVRVRQVELQKSLEASAPCRPCT